ncbi:MAG TPA: hypothetical protein VNP04_15485 [Alphaproteobacteria bacterium]|nr:hypothetical protein [Alphaproteobacteria bacterium]
MTPRLHQALIHRWVAQEERLDRRAAVIAVTLANIHRGKDSRPFTLEDFMVHRFGDAAANGSSASAHVQTQTPEQQIALAAALTRALGGTVAREVAG